MIDQSWQIPGDLSSVETQRLADSRRDRLLTGGNKSDSTVEALSKPLVTHRRIPIVGIVGGIGSGKSAVADWVAKYSRVSVINADKLGHEALQSPPVAEALKLRFGQQIIGADGGIVRSELARQVFGSDSGQLVARRDLEQIVHPEIGRRILEAVALAAAQDRDAVLLDAAILLEAGWRSKCDLVVFIESPDADRLARVRENRGWTEDELHRREASQWSLIDKRREADLIVSNDRDLEHAGLQLLEALQHAGVPLRRLSSMT